MEIRENRIQWERGDNFALEKLRASISHSMTSEKKKKKIISCILTMCLSYIKRNKQTNIRSCSSSRTGLKRREMEKERAM